MQTLEARAKLRQQQAGPPARTGHLRPLAAARSARQDSRRRSGKFEDYRESRLAT